ncbi:probable LRR receptor-like serine/threonine-protein kinase At3g47570 [Miscanthus floridulus]|uniref:probable LRR receptor-like serine/threonine-protein kinase At3g47570 n=1 Tax=Miscanthus floridulus TaxID=154761 RepID=UPI003458B108
MAHALMFLLVDHLLIFLLSNPIAILAADSTNNSEIELQALLNFKQGITNDPSGVLTSWDISGSFCTWRGVVCGKALPPSRVVSLELNSLQLAGQLSPSLANLTSIIRLDLGTNSFHGPIPEELGTLPKLQDLILANNSLSGIIPASLFKDSSRLVVINLQRNFLNGPIPDFHTMETLQILNLAENNLSGRIPPSLGNVSSLTDIHLDLNMLDGSVPETLSRIRNLTALTLRYNQFGHFPAELYNMTSLRILDLGNNDLSGYYIPATLGNLLPNLEMLIMSGDNITGLIPPSLANASKLQEIDLSYNALAGPVPLLGSLLHLRVLSLGSNSLKSDNWAFITSLTNCSNLTMLIMDDNRLDGSLPISVGNLSSNLQRLDLGNNQISGKLPEQIGNLSQLQLLAMDQNSISGEIPLSIWNLSALVVLRLSQNRLSGQIAPGVGNLQQLTQLSIDSNSLSGNIPASLGQCQRLTILKLSFNNLDGYIPVGLANITTLFSLDLSKNHLIGSIPQSIGLLEQLVLLNISHNNLSGQIPPSLGNCLSIQQIDLSQNNLTGQIPDFFNNFNALELLNLSYNNFWGPIPTGGVFQNTTTVILNGNIGLCVNATTSASVFPVCPGIAAGGIKKNAHFLLTVILPITIALFLCLCLCLCIIVALLKRRTHRETAPCYKQTMKKVSHFDILKATNWFSSANKISSSGTSSVYIGRFEFDTDFIAIKVFHLDEHGSLNSFLMECEVLRNTRHRNLMKAVTLCSTVDMENKEFKAIVFDFMANGSLDMWLHPKLHKNSPKRVLSLGQRIRIAMDVVSALDYMHNQLTPPLVHCDLKPANVLLDYDVTARVGDFGSAKFLSSSLGSPEGFVGVEGTIGYIAPEYGMGYKISTGCDVYSFGVLLLEMLTGKRPTDIMFSDGMSLHKLVSSAYPNGLHEVLDPYMFQERDLVTLQCYLVPLVEVALLCSMELPKDRPGIRDICSKILDISEAFLKPRCLY